MQANNRYANDVVKRIESDVTAGTIDDAALSAYIVASTVLHSMDGWGYLGRALSAHSAGDRSAAVHLAYYAELRAAMAILASAGIGVLDKQHFVIRADGKCRLIPGKPTTHSIAWDALEQWAGLPHAGDLVGETITPAGVPLKAWLALPGLPVPWRPLGSDWLRAWGADLRYLLPDRTVRNESSYRPTALHERARISPRVVQRLLTDTWRSLEPSAAGRVDGIDRVLLHSAVRYAHMQLSAAGMTMSLRDYAELVVDGAGYAGATKKTWVRFLARTIPDDHNLAALAKLPATSRSPRYHYGVVARAALLLRVATGIARRQMATGGIGGDALGFWADMVGVARGYWTAPARPTPYGDLWLDVEAALIKAEAASVASMTAWLQTAAESTSVLGQAERVALWMTLD